MANHPRFYMVRAKDGQSDPILVEAHHPSVALRRVAEFFFTAAPAKTAEVFAHVKGGNLSLEAPHEPEQMDIEEIPGALPNEEALLMENIPGLDAEDRKILEAAYEDIAKL